MPVRAVSVVRVVVQPTEINKIDARIAVYEDFMMFLEGSHERCSTFNRRDWYELNDMYRISQLGSISIACRQHVCWQDSTKSDNGRPRSVDLEGASVTLPVVIGQVEPNQIHGTLARLRFTTDQHGRDVGVLSAIGLDLLQVHDEERRR